VVRARLLVIVAAVVALIAGCSNAPESSVGASGSAAPTTPLAVGLGFIPSVQFAPFYLADQAGYYRDAGLDVSFRHGTDYDVIALVGEGDLDIGLADGTSVIPAVSQGIPVQYVFTVYADFPSIVFAKASSGIVGPADLPGKKVGIPGQYGSSWIQLQALLAGVGLTTADIEIVPFPTYGQLAALEQGVVDAATGFVNNEPVQMELAGTPTVVLALPPSDQLPGNGLIAGKAALTGSKADAIRRFIAATRKATEEIIADPEVGLEAAIVRVPELATDRAAQLAVLEATIDTWQNDFTAANGIGAVDPAVWERSIAFMSGLPDSPVAKPVTVDECIDPTFAAP
jgi:NitT/TauT family transport system substrate-binding protein